MDLKLSHYAIAVHDLDAAVETYKKFFGLKEAGQIHNEWGGFDAVELGYSGERTLLLMSPTDPNNNISKQMKLRSTNANPHGEGFHVAVFQSDDPRAAGQEVEKNGAKVIDSGTDYIIVHPMATHFVLWEIQPTRQPHDPGIDFKFSHIGIAVNDLEAAIKTYTSIFPLVQEPAIWASEEGKFKVAPVSLDGRQVTTLIEPQADDAPVKRLMQSRTDEFNPHGEGFYMAIWTSKDPAALAEKVSNAGGKVIPTGDPSGRFLIHPSSTHGILMEIAPEKE